MTMEVKINIIAAVADNLAIGNKGKLLWHISGDLRYFKKLTTGNPVIMGRKTFESIGKPLPGRLNIVVTRNQAAEFPEGVVRAGSLEEAIDAAKKHVLERSGAETGSEQPEGNVFVIGGAEIYRQAIEFADRMYITHVHARPTADTFFPDIDRGIWVALSCSESHLDPISGLYYWFVVYERKEG